MAPQPNSSGTPAAPPDPSARTKQGDNTSRVPANCKGGALCGTTAELKPWNMTLREKLHSKMQDMLMSMGMQPYWAGVQADKVFGGGNYPIGVADVVPGVSQTLTGDEVAGNLEAGNKGMAAAGAIGLIPIPGVGKLAGKAAEKLAQKEIEKAAEKKAEAIIFQKAEQAAQKKSEEDAAAAAAKKAGEPVSVATGEYIETWGDFVIPATLSFDGARYMGLRLSLPEGYANPLGPCQVSAFDEIISNPAPGKLVLLRADGKAVAFKRPFNFVASYNASFPNLDLRAPWLGQLELRDGNLVKHFRACDDRIYRLEKIEDRNGHAVTFVRDSAGRLLKAEGTNGLALVFENNARGLREVVTLIGTDGSRLELARYAYGPRGHMTSADCRFGMSVRYAWDAERDLLLNWHDTTRRSETHFTYDSASRVVHTRTSGIWNDDRFRYDPAARVTTYLPAGDESLAQRFGYDERDNVTAETDALGHTVLRTFDRAGFETSLTDANGNVASTAYDPRGHVRQHTDAEGRSTFLAWGPHGELDMVVDGAGNARRFHNDERGNTLTETDADGNTTRFVRDSRGRLLRTAFANGAEESRSYDALGRLSAIIDARGGTTTFRYDVFGRVIEKMDALGGITRAEYDGGAGGFATVTAVVQPDGVRITRTFSAEGSLAAVTDGEGRRWVYSYGAFGVLQTIEDPGGGKLNFAHDGEGRVIAVTNQKGNIYRLARDTAGRVVAEEDFDGRRTRYVRDAGGRIVETLKSDGVRLVNAYDRTDRLTAIRCYAPDAAPGAPPLEETHFWYDRRGLVVRAANKAALVEFERDGNGRVVRETMNGRVVESELDACGLRVVRRLGSGRIAIGRDPLGAVASIAIDDHAPLAFARDALGRETCRVSAQGFRLDTTFDVIGRVMTQTAGPAAARLAAPSGAPAASAGALRRYAWDKAGAPVAIDEMIWGDTRFSYDANGQVACAEFGDGTSESFDYDPAKTVKGVALRGPQVGARLSGLLAWQSTAGGVVQLARGPNGETIALTHDACGRVIERRIDRKGFRPRIWRYAWDALDQLVRCDNPEGETWFYRYDAFGRRLTKVRRLAEQQLAWTAQKHPALVSQAAREATKLWTWPEPPGGAATGDQRAPIVGVHFSWDGDVVAEEAPLRLDGTIDWAEATRWHFEPESFVPLAKQTPDGRLLPIVTDHLGTPREMFEETGRVAWAASYTTWGTIRDVTTPPEATNDDRRAIYPRGAARGDPPEKTDKDASQWACPIRFQGQWADAETGLAYNRHRHYDALVGQYTSVDPIGLNGGSRPQAYVECPLTSLDPLGWSAVSKDTLGRPTAWNNTVGPNDVGTGTATDQAARDFARGRGNPTDDAGHALGRNLGGSGTDLDNIFPQALSVNRGKFRAFEQQIAKRIKATGQSAKLNLTPSYSGDSFRPSSLNYSATFSDGTHWTQTFPNP